MPKLGPYDYPVSGLERVVNAAKEAANQFRDETFNRDALASCLGFKNSQTGSFNQLLADLKKYGLLDGRGDDIHITDTSKRLYAYASQAEYDSAVMEAFLSIPLFRELYEKYRGAKPDSQSFFTTLLHLTRADRMDIRTHAERIRDLFNDGSRMLATASGNVSAPTGSLGETREPREPTQFSGQFQDPFRSSFGEAGSVPDGIKEYRDGAVHVRVPDDPRHLEDLRDLLDMWLAKSRRRVDEQREGARERGSRPDE